MPGVRSCPTVFRETGMRVFAKKATSRIIVAALLCWVVQGFAQAPTGDTVAQLNLSLEAAIALAVRNNRELINAQLGRVSERFSLRVAENKFRPHITIGSRFDRTYTAPSSDIHTFGLTSTVALRIPTGGAFGVEWSSRHRTGEVDSHIRYANELLFTFTQPLLRGAGIRVNTASVRIARMIDEINLLALRQTIIDVVFRVTQHYRDYLQAGHRVDIRTQSLQRARDLLAVNELLVRSGRMAERDIVQTKADIANRELLLIAAQNRLDAARLALADILDVDSNTRIRLTDSPDAALNADSVPVDLAEHIETALAHRPDYRRAVLSVNIAESEVLVANSNRLWDLEASLSAKFTGMDESLGRAVDRFDNSDYSAWLNLSIPIGLGAVDPRKQQQVIAAIHLRQARVELANVRQRINIQVSNAVREVELSQRQVELARSARELAERKTELEKEKLRLGLSSNFQLVSFEEDLVSAQNSELDALIAYRAAVSSLDRTLGTTLERWNIEFDETGRKDVR